MAAAVVAGVLPIMHSVASNQAGYYIGRKLWFGAIAIYGLVVYVVRMPWVHIKEDFLCHGSITRPCLIECFEETFQVPIMGTWYLAYFLFLALFLLMELFLAQIRHMYFTVRSVTRKMSQKSVVAIQEEDPAPKKSTLNFHRDKLPLFFYLFYFLLQGSVQGVFLYHLTFQQLPLVRPGTIHCSTTHCPGPYGCLIRVTVDKQMSIYILMASASVIILLCVGFFIYTVHHYLMNGHSDAKVGGD